MSLTGKTIGRKPLRYAVEEDMKILCDKCRKGFYGDFLPEDCLFCTFRQVVDKCKEYAWKLAVLND